VIILWPCLCSITSRSNARLVTHCCRAKRKPADNPVSAQRHGNEPNGATCGCPAIPVTTSSGKRRSTSRCTTSTTTGPTVVSKRDYPLWRCWSNRGKLANSRGPGRDLGVICLLIRYRSRSTGMVATCGSYTGDVRTCDPSTH
jgi:hypothetical protein